MNAQEILPLNENKDAAIIFQTCRIQQFSLRKPLIEYIINHFTSLKLYMKLIKTCKLVFVKNPILVLPCLFNKTFWITGTSLSSLSIKLDLNKIKYKIWLTESLHIPYNPPSNIATSLIPSLFRCDVNVIFLANQILTINELKFLGASAWKCTLMNTEVKHFDDSDASFFSILQQFPNFKYLSLHGQTFYTDIEKLDMAQVLKLTSKLENFCLHGITESFDIENFFQHLKSIKNRTSVLLSFDDGLISAAYGNLINAIVDEIMATKSFTYLPPKFRSNFLGHEKEYALNELVKHVQTLFNS